MLKNRIKKQEARQPKPEPDNIVYTTCWGGEAPEREGELIKTKGKNPRLEFYRLDDGTIKEIWIYESGPWAGPEFEKMRRKNERRLLDEEQTDQD